MKKLEIIKKTLWSLLFLNIILFIFFFVIDNYLNNQYLVSETKQIISTPVEYSNIEQFTVSNNLYLFKIFSKSIRIDADDCVKSIFINGKKIESSNKTCRYENNNEFNIKPFILFGKNRFSAIIQNNGGKTAINKISIHYDEKKLLFISGIILIFILLILEQKIFLVFGGLILIRLFYLDYTPYTIRSHDIQNHLNYIKYINSNDQIYFEPEFQKQHPFPLYYVISGKILKISENLNLPNPSFNIQLFMVLLNIILLVYLYKTLQIYNIKKKNIILILITIGCLPGLVFGSSRINNDGLARSLFFIFIYYQTLLIKQGFKIKDILICSMIGIASIFAKKTNIVIIPIFGLISLFYSFLNTNISGIKNSIIKYIKINLIFIIPILLVFIPISWKLHKQGIQVLKPIPQTLILNNGLKIENNIERYFKFNINEIIKNPFTSAWRDDLGRQNFFEYLFKTSLFGEFGYSEKIKNNAKIIIILSLTIIGFLIIWSLINIKFLIKNHYETIVYISCLLTGIIFLVKSAPYACSQDFRYIAGIVIPIGIIIGLFLESCKNYFVYTLSYIFIIIFNLHLIIFYILLN